MKPSHILYVDDSLMPSYGGTKRVLTNLFTAIDRRRWIPHVLYYRTGPYLQDAIDMGIWAKAADELALRVLAKEHERRVASGLDGVGVRRTTEGDLVRSRARLFAYDLRSLTQYFVLDRWRSKDLRRFLPDRVDLIHVNAWMHDSYEWAHVAARLGVPFVTHEHGVWRRPPAAFRSVARGAASVICLTEERIEQVREFCRGRVRTDLVPNGIPMSRMVAKRSREEERAELGVGPETPLLITAGHLQPWKGQSLAVEAAQLLAAQGADFHWVLCGAHVVDGYVQEIRDQIRKHDLQSRFTLLGERDDLPDLFEAADLAVHTTIRPEPFGMVVIEAMAMATPVVGAGEGALPTLVRDGNDGLLYRPRDPVSMAEKICTLLRSPGERTRMGNEARARVRHEFDVTSQVERICAIYDRALGDSGRSSDKQTVR